MKWKVERDHFVIIHLSGKMHGAVHSFKTLRPCCDPASFPINPVCPGSNRLLCMQSAGEGTPSTYLEKNCLYNHFGGAKASFCYVYLQVNNSVDGPNHAKFGGIALVPSCRYVPGVAP